MNIVSSVNRRSSVAGLLVLIAASAFGMGALRLTLQSSSIGGHLRHAPARYSHIREEPLGFLALNFNLALVNGVPLMVVASAAVVVSTLCSARFSARMLRRSPGFILCLTAVSVSALTEVVLGSALWLNGEDYDLALWKVIVFGILPNTGHAVLGAWLAMNFGGRARPPSSRLDLFGYMLGAIWIILLALEDARIILEHAHLM